MAEGTSKENQESGGKGFAGLASLLSDVSAVEGSVDRSLSENDDDELPSVSGERSRAQPLTPSSPILESPSNYQAPSTPKKGDVGERWFWGIGFAALAVWGLYAVSNSQSNSSGATTTPSVHAAKPTVGNPQTNPVQSRITKIRFTEERPDIGSGKLLGASQIRYCLAEDIRLTAAKQALDGYSDREVNRFNEMISDYNNRCGQYKYKGDALASARSEVERFRLELGVDGRRRFLSSPSSDPGMPPPPPSPRSPVSTVQAIQERLNELGYKPGAADGLMGGATRAAIVEFQNENGHKADGVADAALLSILKDHRVERKQSANAPTRREPKADDSRSKGADRMFNDAREQIERRHPELNPDSPLYRQELIDAVIKGTNFYVRNGLARNAALVRAVADMERDAFFGGSTVTQGTSRQPST
ncbi:MAG TPA: peptidoglycan-binding domain-containing protein, partial [Planctomycetaceae bacterium]|nr:peptidoglycan-binding domain-containing protein [Planctomycetaceae bacterium]